MKFVKNISKKLAAVKCSFVNHNYKEIAEKQITHNVGCKKIKGYGGRVKEIRQKLECKNCGNIMFKTIYIEMDHFESDHVPEDIIENPMILHLKNADIENIPKKKIRDKIQQEKLAAIYSKH
jgi:hypothetical protein